MQKLQHTRLSGFPPRFDNFRPHTASTAAIVCGATTSPDYASGVRGAGADSLSGATRAAGSGILCGAAEVSEPAEIGVVEASEAAEIGVVEASRAADEALAPFISRSTISAARRLGFILPAPIRRRSSSILF